MSKEKTAADQPKKVIKQIPTQKTLSFPVFTPSFIIDFFINRWLKSLVIDQGVVPMKGDATEGFLFVRYSYLYTSKHEDNTSNNTGI